MCVVCHEQQVENPPSPKCLATVATVGIRFTFSVPGAADGQSTKFKSAGYSGYLLATLWLHICYCGCEWRLGWLYPSGESKNSIRCKLHRFCVATVANPCCCSHEISHNSTTVSLRLHLPIGYNGYKTLYMTEFQQRASCPPKTWTSLFSTTVYMLLYSAMPGLML